MLIFVLGVILGALIQIGTIYLLKQEILKSYIYAIPLILGYQFLFLWAYTKAPNFLLIWFITTALTNSLAFLVGYFLYHNHISTWGLVGIVLIFTGVIFLQIKQTFLPVILNLIQNLIADQFAMKKYMVLK